MFPMNTTYLSYLFLHHLLSLIIHREENCQISIHSIAFIALQPLLSPGLPQQTPRLHTSPSSARLTVGSYYAVFSSLQLLFTPYSQL